MSAEKVPELSRRVSSMKFMQKREESVIRQKLEDERTKSLKEAHWVALGQQKPSDEAQVITEEVMTSKFVAGRRSFGGFNPVVQKLVEVITTGVSEEISNDKMADLYQEYKGLRPGGRGGKGGKRGGRDENRNHGGTGEGRNTVDAASGFGAAGVQAMNFLDQLAGDLDHKVKTSRAQEDSKKNENNAAGDDEDDEEESEKEDTDVGSGGDSPDEADGKTSSSGDRGMKRDRGNERGGGSRGRGRGGESAGFRGRGRGGSFDGGRGGSSDARGGGGGSFDGNRGRADGGRGGGKAISYETRGGRGGGGGSDGARGRGSFRELLRGRGGSASGEKRKFEQTSTPGTPQGRTNAMAFLSSISNEAPRGFMKPPPLAADKLD